MICHVIYSWVVLGMIIILPRNHKNNIHAKERKIMLQFSILTIGTFVTILDAICIYVARACFSKDIKKIIPIFSIIFGIILGIAGYYTPDVEMGSNLIEAIFIGLSAGAAATGVNQVGKQLGKDDSMNSVIEYLKKFIDDVDVPEDGNIIPCDGDNEESSETTTTEDVPSATDNKNDE